MHCLLYSKLNDASIKYLKGNVPLATIMNGNKKETISGSIIVSVVILNHGTAPYPIMYYSIGDSYVEFSHNPSSSLIGAITLNYYIFYIKKK